MLSGGECWSVSALQWQFLMSQSIIIAVFYEQSFRKSGFQVQLSRLHQWKQMWYYKYEACSTCSLSKTDGSRLFDCILKENYIRRNVMIQVQNDQLQLHSAFAIELKSLLSIPYYDAGVDFTLVLNVMVDNACGRKVLFAADVNKGEELDIVLV